MQDQDAAHGIAALACGPHTYTSHNRMCLRKGIIDVWCLWMLTSVGLHLDHVSVLVGLAAGLSDARKLG